MRCPQISPWAVVLLLGIGLIITNAADAKSTHRMSSQQPFETESSPTPEQKAYFHAHGGNDLVHETWSVLRDFESPWGDSITSPGTSTLIGKIWHYSKIVLRALFMNSPTRSDEGYPKVRGELKNAVAALEIGAQYQDADAIYLLAQMNFFGNFSHPRDFPQAYKWYKQLADAHGNASAQHMVGLMHATGIGGAVERDQARAMIYHTFAAEQGNTQAELTLAFRHHSGIGTARDCNKASKYYKRVADKAMTWWHSGPPGGHMMQKNSVRWIEYEGGSFGEGASASSSGPHAYRDGTVAASLDDVLELLDVRERQGDWQAVLTMAKYYYEPPRGYRRNFRKAQMKFNKIARAYWKDGKINQKAPKGVEKHAGKAAAYLGRMWLRGEGMKQDYEKAMAWFVRGIENGDSFCQYHLGIMHRDGLGVPVNGYKAATLLNAAAEQGLAVAQSALGVLFLDQGDVEIAVRYFELAAAAGVMEAYYYLAEIVNQGIGTERNCALAVTYYKIVAEKAEILHSSFAEANAAYDRGDLDRAFVLSLLAAEQGYESAQANVALLLDQNTSIIKLPSLPLLSNPLSPVSYHGIKRSKLLNDPALALVYFTRSAKQANTDSLIKVGDYYLSGVNIPSGVPSSPSAPQASAKAFAADISQPAPDLDKASTCYTTAAESRHSSHALWNMGWMHENGIGPIAQDFHMAKRYYDMALEMNKEAYLPVKLALIKLRLRSWWNGISGGKVRGIRRDDDDDDAAATGTKQDRPKTFMEWLNRFLDAAEAMDAQEYADAVRQQDGAADGADGIGAPDRPGGDGNYFYNNNDEQGNQERGAAVGAGARGNADGVGDEYLDGDFGDDGLVESLVIIALAGVLALLIYARQQRQQRQERQQQQQQQQQQQPPPPPHDTGAGVVAGEGHENNEQNQPNGGVGANPGFFPGANEPDFANWVAGGIGH